jgi:hypothetical protein
MRWLSGHQGPARPLPYPERLSHLSARHQATPICCPLLPEPRTGYGSVGQRPGQDPLTSGNGVGLQGLEPRTSSLSDPTKNYADVIRGCEVLWRIVGNAQVEAAVDTRADPWFLTVLPCLLGFLRRAIAARLLPQVWGKDGVPYRPPHLIGPMAQASPDVTRPPLAAHGCREIELR